MQKVKKIDVKCPSRARFDGVAHRARAKQASNTIITLDGKRTKTSKSFALPFMPYVCKQRSYMSNSMTQLLLQYSKFSKRDLF